MKIISYNVNGIRAAIAKGFMQWLEKEQPDILCLQELKAQREQIPVEDFNALGYNYYGFSAQKKGYSGVAILTRKEPDNVVYGINIAKYDLEGRVVRVDYGDLSVISVYHPSGTSGEERQEFKYEWLDDFLKYINELKKQRYELIICGDFNIAHNQIDIHNPKGNEKNSGFLPDERKWLTSFLQSGFIDTYRFLKPNEQVYSWWSYRFHAREKNLGWRIDYCMVTENLKEQIKDANILTSAEHSDHCPVLLELKIKNQ